MKKGIIHLLLLLLLGPVQAQTVLLPDTNFSNCLKTNFPLTINSLGQLVISEANNAKGTLSCANMNIKSAEGLQYFTSLSSIKLQKNSISYFPQIPQLISLQHFDVSENQLPTLPYFGNSKRLKDINAQRNILVSLPNLSKNDSLQVLYVHSNNLDTLPDLSNLKNLNTLNLTYNKLQYLPNIEKLISLQYLYAWKNQLIEVQPLNTLTNLVYIDISYNQLSKVPDLGSKPNMTIAFFNDNNISTVTDFTLCPKLQNVRLYNNPLTFKELRKLINIPGYDTLFKLLPNQALLVGKSVEVNQSKFLALSTGIDIGIPGMKYEWYKNGTLLSIQSFDSLKIKNATLQDFGKYTCLIKNNAFPNLALKTDTFNVKVIPCPDPNNLSIFQTEINCLSAGTVNVSGYNSLIYPADFELASKIGNKVIQSSTGSFYGLSETVYRLNIRVKNGCTYTHPELITIIQKECEEVLISPDNDGTSDSYYFSDTGKAIIYDKRGNIVKTIVLPGIWDGTSDKGKVNNGFFVADINNGNKLIGITVLY